MKDASNKNNNIAPLYLKLNVNIYYLNDLKFLKNPEILIIQRIKNDKIVIKVLKLSQK